MMCEHMRLKAIGNRIFCMDCNAELPLEFLTAGNGHKKPSEACEGEKVNKSPRRKRTAKNGE